MSENRKQKISNDAKPKYEPPQVIILSESSKGSGIGCTNGSGNIGNCTDGNSPGSGCYNGTSPV